MACGNNNPQQSNIQTGTQTADGSPPMSLVVGGTNAIPVQTQQPLAPQQMAQQAAAMPTVNTTGVIDGIMPDGSYNPKYDQTIQQISGRMKAMQDSGAFLTPYQKAMQKHPIIMGLANGMQAFGQGITGQPFYTANQDQQAGLQNTEMQNASQLMSPANMMNMMFMKQMMGAQPTPVTPTSPVISTPGGASAKSIQVGKYTAQ